MKRKTLRICYLVLECLLESHETAKLRKITHLAVFFLPHRIRAARKRFMIT